MKSAEAKKQREELLNHFITRNSFEYQRWGEIDGKYVPFPIKSIKKYNIETAEPGEPDIYKNKQDWYFIRELIPKLAEQAYFSYYIGAHFASFLCSIDCIELTLKYEYLRQAKGKEKIKRRKEFNSPHFTFGTLLKKDLGTIDPKLTKFKKDLDLLNEARNGLMHFNKEKLKKATIKINNRLCKRGVPFLIGVIMHEPKIQGTIKSKTGHAFHRENYSVPTNNVTEISKFAYFAYMLNKSIIEKIYSKR